MPDPTDPSDRSRSFTAAARRHTGRPDGLLIVDIETTGLAATPLFLIGLLLVEDHELRIHQYFARTYAEEAAVLNAFLRRAVAADGLVTFNGLRFDLPFIDERIAYHGIPRLLLPPQIDLLPLARRRWRAVVPDCRLVTLEAHRCGRPRVDDVPSSEVPARYHDYLRTGRWETIVPVLHHNALDLIATAELLPMLLDDRLDEAPLAQDTECPRVRLLPEPLDL